MAANLMLDAIEASRMVTGLNATANVAVIAGYVGGNWPTYAGFQATYGSRLPVLSIAISSSELAMCLDVESGDATNATAPDWFHRQAGLKVFYTSVSNANALVNTLAAAGIPRNSYLLWLAHYGVGEHLCSPTCYRGNSVTADATQYNDAAPGPCDLSVLSNGFISAVQQATGHALTNPVAAPSAPTPKVASTLNLVPSGNSAAILQNGNTRGLVWNDGSVWLVTSGFPAGVPFTILDPSFKNAFVGREVAKVTPHGTYGYILTDTAGETYTIGN